MKANNQFTKKRTEDIRSEIAKPGGKWMQQCNAPAYIVYALMGPYAW